MKTIKAGTKAGQAIIADYNRFAGTSRSIFTAYGKPSTAKVCAYLDIEKRAKETAGYRNDLAVCGAGSSYFSTIYSFVDEIGKLFIVKDTASNTYIVEA